MTVRDGATKNLAEIFTAEVLGNVSLHGAAKRLRKSSQIKTCVKRKKQQSPTHVPGLLIFFFFASFCIALGSISCYPWLC